MFKREFLIFLVVGSLTVFFDFVTYRGLYALGLMSVDIAKGTGFCAGTLFAYFANRFWTFGHKLHASGSIWRFILLYAITLATNVFINSFMLNILPQGAVSVRLAFLVATGTSATLNFLGMKCFVFRAKSQEAL